MKNNYEIRGEVTAIFITYKGERFETLIDTNDLEKCRSFPNSWRIRYLKNTDTYYVQGSIGEADRNRQRKTIQLHRWLSDAADGYLVDHKNNNGLDNRRSSNLRIANKSENGQNRKGAQKNSASGIRGVSWHKTTEKWHVQVKINGLSKYFGLYSDLEEAREVAENARKMIMPFSKEGAG